MFKKLTLILVTFCNFAMEAPLNSHSSVHEQMQNLAEINETIDLEKLKRLSIVLKERETKVPTPFGQDVIDKALLGLAIKWKPDFGAQGIEIAKILVQRFGADPKRKFIISQIAASGKSGCYKTTETITVESAYTESQGLLKEYFNSCKAKL